MDKHRDLSIMKQDGILGPDGTEMGAVKNEMKLIANSPSAGKVDAGHHSTASAGLVMATEHQQQFQHILSAQQVVPC